MISIMRINWNGAVDPLFKLAVVLGPSRVPGKLRVRVWLDAPRRWSTASAVSEQLLSDVDERSLSPRHASVFRRARAAAESMS